MKYENVKNGLKTRAVILINSKTIDKNKLIFV